MDLRGRRKSSNIEDRRGMRPVRTGVGLSLGGVLFLVVLSLLGINPLPFLGVATQAPQTQVQDTGQPGGRIKSFAICDKVKPTVRWGWRAMGLKDSGGT